ncbi:alkaline phosphatase family protein, partial [Candidatus Babeliales bacterium]|nr:alkaline phosphatase family protein [Candidatus Babeliales bacterium]
MQRRNVFLFTLIVSCSSFFLYAKAEEKSLARFKRPRLVIPIVIDQGSKVLLDKTLPFTSQGLYRMYKSGLSHEQASFPHACPNTSAGHAGLSTGVYPDTHGIIDNKYIDEQGVEYTSDEDNSEESLVFKKDGSLYKHGRSALRLKSDTLLDQVMLESEPVNEWRAASFSIKSRAAVMLAGHQGEAFWFDGSSGSLTTSKAYASKMPEWVNQFNDQHGLSKNSSYIWKPFLSIGSD